MTTYVARGARPFRRAVRQSASCACAAFLVLPAVTAQAQPPAGRGRGAPPPQRRQDYPQRPPGDPAAIERGKALYGVNCQFCDAANTGAGDGGPSLLRSSIVLADDQGELIGPVVRSGRPGMPKFTLTDSQIADVAAFVHTFRAAGYDESRLKPPSIVVGDAKAGETFFRGKCASCHSPTGDLRGIATKIDDPRLLQQTWLLPGTGAGRGAAPPVPLKPTTVIVTLPSGEKVEGKLDRVDDYVVALTTGGGSLRSFHTNGG